MKITRRILRNGSTTLAVSIPVDWKRLHGLKAGDVVEIDEEDETLTIRSPKRPPNKEAKQEIGDN